MKAPVLAALAPGVVVSGRMVSAISSSRATSAAVNAPTPCGHGLVERGGVERERLELVAAGQREPAHQRHHPLHGVASVSLPSIVRPPPSYRLPRFSSSTANAEARAVSAM